MFFTQLTIFYSLTPHKVAIYPHFTLGLKIPNTDEGEAAQLAVVEPEVGTTENHRSGEFTSSEVAVH